MKTYLLTRINYAEKPSRINSLIMPLLILFVFSLTTDTPGQRTTAITDEGSIISYYGTYSKECKEQTRILREYQIDNPMADNGEDIIFVNEGIYVQFADGSGKRLLIAEGTGINNYIYPTWSLDGTRIAFAAKRTDPRVVDLCVANADGSDITVIFTFDMGYYQSIINSISWQSTNQYLMFTIAYDDAQLNSYFIIATILSGGGNISFGNAFDITYSQYDPLTSNRYAYTSSGLPPDFTSKLSVVNSGNTTVWLTHQTVSGFTHVCWNNSNSIYTILRYWDQHPNKEVLVRANRSGSSTTFTPLIFSDPYASLWSPTVSPDRTKLYLSELTSTSLTMYLVTFNSSGEVVSTVAKGDGAFTNWRQALPPSPPQVVLLSPANNASGISINPVLSWQAAATANSYEVKVFNEGGSLIYSNSTIATTQVQIGPLDYLKKYFWLVRAKNTFGYGQYSTPFNFTTQSISDINDETGGISFWLSQNYPNPYNPATQISYGIAASGEVELLVFDIYGEEVAELVNEYQSTGNYTIKFNASALPSGVYFYRLHAGRFC